MKKRFLALALGTLAFGVTLGGVKMGSGHQDAMMVKAEAETAFSTLTFSSKTNSKAVDGYIYSWTCSATNGTVFTLTNFSNYNNQWNYVRCGRKGNPSIASIVNSKAMADLVTSIQITLDKIDGTYVNSIELLVSDTSDFKEIKETHVLTKTAGDQKVGIDKPASNLFYKFMFNCKSAPKKPGNGFVQVSKVDFFKSGSSIPDPEPEPVSPVNSISAAQKNPDAVFYTGCKVTLDDFVITATREDGKTEELTSGVVLKNDTLVEGANTVEFEYVENGKTFNCNCQVTAISKPLYTKSTNVADIVVGKRILITNSNGTMAMGAQQTNNRGYVASTPSEDKIALADGMASLLVVPAKNGTFAFYDEASKGLLYAASDTANQLKTMTRFSSINENAFANIGYKESVWSIQFTGSNSHSEMRYNPNGGKGIFACYTPGKEGMENVSVYVSSEAPATFNADAWADSFIANVSSKCDATGETATWTADWDKAKAVFDGFGIPDKMAVLYGTGSEKVNQAIANYKFIVDKYNVDDYLGLGTGKTNKANALMLPGATDSTTWTLVGIGAVTIAASASLLFFRRKKSN